MARLRPLLVEEAPPRNVLALPRTTTESERWSEELLSVPPKLQGTVAISCKTLDVYESLSDACRSLGLTTVRCSPGEMPYCAGMAAGIWDAVRGDEQEWQAIGQFVAAMRAAPVIVTEGFPRPHDDEHAHSAGVWKVLGKPFSLSSFWQTLSSAISPTPRTQLE